MKKSNWASKILIFILIGISVYFAFRIQFIYSEKRLKNTIIESVIENIDEFNDYSQQLINKEITSGELKGFKVQRDIDYPNILNFSYAAKGLGSGNIYYGVYYIPDGMTDTYFSGKLNKKDNNSWFYSEENSDNTMYIEKIDNNYYYYKNTF